MIIMRRRGHVISRMISRWRWSVMCRWLIRIVGWWGRTGPSTPWISPGSTGIATRVWERWGWIIRMIRMMMSSGWRHGISRWRLLQCCCCRCGTAWIRVSRWHVLGRNATAIIVTIIIIVVIVLVIIIVVVVVIINCTIRILLVRWFVQSVGIIFRCTILLSMLWLGCGGVFIILLVVVLLLIIRRIVGRSHRLLVMFLLRRWFPFGRLLRFIIATLLGRCLFLPSIVGPVVVFRDWIIRCRTRHTFRVSVSSSDQ